MSRQGDFLIYCVETYKNAKHLTGKQVAELFTRYRVWDYVYSCFEALHTTGANYIVDDIDLYKVYADKVDWSNPVGFSISENSTAPFT